MLILQANFLMNFPYRKFFIFLTEPLIPYRVTVVAVNLAGPGEQEMKNFFTREGGVCLIMQVVYMTYCLVHFT